MRALAPPKNFSERHWPAVCANCYWLDYNEQGRRTSTLDCARPGGPSFNVHDGEYRHSKCDGFKRGAHIVSGGR